MIQQQELSLLVQTSVPLHHQLSINRAGTAEARHVTVASFATGAGGILKVGVTQGVRAGGRQLLKAGVAVGVGVAASGGLEAIEARFDLPETTSTYLSVGVDVVSLVLARRRGAPTSGLSQNVTGLSAQQAAQIEQKLLSVPGAKKVKAFGSRTKGTSKPDSDLDIALVGNIDKRDPAVLAVIREAQNLARQAGIGTGKGFRPLDISITPSTNLLKKAILANPDFDPSRGIPMFKRLK